MLRVKVLLFARIREVAGIGSLDRQVPPGCSVEQVWDRLVAETPALAPHRAALSAAVNAEFASFSAVVHDGDEIAFLPPVSGG